MCMERPQGEVTAPPEQGIPLAEDDPGRDSCCPEDNALDVPSLEATGQSRRAELDLG